MSTTRYEITGRVAMQVAERLGGALRAHADPTGAEDREVTLEEAEELCREDPALVYIAYDTTTARDLAVCCAGPWPPGLLA